MKTNPDLRHVIFLALMTALFLAIAITQAPGQLVVEGTATSGLDKPQGHAMVFDISGEQKPLRFKGKKRKYRAEFEDKNMAHRIDFYLGDKQRTIHIFTHQPKGYYSKQWVEVDINMAYDSDEWNSESVIYWSPSQGVYVHLPNITREDATQLAEMNLWPTRIRL